MRLEPLSSVLGSLEAPAATQSMPPSAVSTDELSRTDHAAMTPARDRQPLPEHPKPMLATLGTLPPAREDERWAYEMKWDGVRSLVRLDHGRTQLISRNDIDMVASYPELVPLGALVGRRQMLLDGEIVSFDEQGRPSFSRLQKRMHISSAPAAQQLASADPVVLLIFDLLHLAGESLVQLPYVERRRRLEALSLSGPAWQTPPVFHGNGAEAVQVSQAGQLEGVMAKRLASPYRYGRRSPDWVKVKNVRTQEVIVGGWKPGAGRRTGAIGALLLGIPSEDGLVYVGKVGTGFTDAILTDLGRRLEPLRRSSCPFIEVRRPDTREVQWVTPRLVGEVAFTEWTPEGRLRHPSWRGLRPDKRPDEVVRES
jgi:bifunctional non-homologous end joining protein LigD